MFDCMGSDSLEGVLELEPVRNLKVHLEVVFKFLDQYVICEQL